MVHDQGSRFFRAIVALLEWMLKRVGGRDRWRPAGTILALPPTALIHDAREGPRADRVARVLTDLGFAPRKVGVEGATGDPAGVGRAITRGAAGCWAAVLLEPDDDASARGLGPAFRRYAHLHADVVAVVAGPLPSRAEVLDRYLHVVTAEDGGVTPADLAAGIAHACAARVRHCARLLNAAVVFLSIVTVVIGVAMAFLGWSLAH